MAYYSIDEVLERWCASNRLKLFRSFAGREARFCYTSSGAGECFQISLDPPSVEGVTINAWSVDTTDDEELRETWLVARSDLRAVLDNALDQVERWKARTRGARQ